MQPIIEVRNISKKYSRNEDAHLGYGIRDLFVGVPVKLGARGVEQIVEIKLTAEEDAALKRSAAAVRELVEIIKV